MAQEKEPDCGVPGKPDCVPALPSDEQDVAFSHIPEHGFSLFLAQRTKTIHFGERPARLPPLFGSVGGGGMVCGV